MDVGPSSQRLPWPSGSLTAEGSGQTTSREPLVRHNGYVNRAAPEAMVVVEAYFGAAPALQMLGCRDENLS